MDIAPRSPSEVLRKGYSEDEISHIYELARLSLENGQISTAETLLEGITEVAPDFASAWLARSYIAMVLGDLDKAVFSARQALRIQPSFTEALLFLIACLMSVGDFNSAGTHLGEVGERVEAGQVADPNTVRLYKTQLLRFQNRMPA